MVKRGVIILSTFPNEMSVVDIANKLVKNKLCACINFTKIRSIYSWQNKIENQQEVMAFFKTSYRSAEKLKMEIATLHPYKVPEIVELKMEDVSKTYLHWLVESTDGVPKKRHNAAKR